MNIMGQVSLINFTASLVGAGGIQAFKTMRTLRALRPLRAMSRMQGMRVCINLIQTSIASDILTTSKIVFTYYGFKSIFYKNNYTIIMNLFYEC